MFGLPVIMKRLGFGHRQQTQTLGLPVTVRGTARNYNGHLIERFSQGSRAEGVRDIMDQLPQANSGVCKSLCMNWIDHHANDKPGRFTDRARSMGSGNGRFAGNFSGVSMVLDQLDYHNVHYALPATANRADYIRAKDKFTDDFLRERGIVRQMNIKYPTLNLSQSMDNHGPCAGSWFGRQLALAIVGNHSASYWSYKIVSIHGQAGGHVIAAFVGDDAVFFDPNYGIFYFEKLNDFRRWFGELDGFYATSGYNRYLGEDFVIRSYAKSI